MKNLIFLAVALSPLSLFAQTEGDYPHQLTDVAVRLDGGSVVASGGGAVATDTIWDAAGDLAYGTGADTGAALAKGTATQVLHSGNTPSWAAVNLTNDVTGTLAAASFADNTVAPTRLAFTATDRLACRDTAAAGAGEECAVNTPLALAGSGLALAITAANDGGAIAKQASAPGTVQSTAFWNVDGLGTVTKNDIKTTATDGLFLSNTTASDAVNTVQYAPALKLCGSGWNSSGAAAETDCFRIYMKPLTVAGTTTNTLNFDASINGGAYSNKMTLSSGGSISNVSGNITSANNITSTAGNISASAGDFIVATGNRYTWLARGGISSSADGQFRTELNAGTASATVFTSGQYKIIGGNSQTTTAGWVSELLTLATGATTTDTTMDLPADSIIDAITYRITTTITTAVSFTIGDPTTATRFCGTQSVMTANTTGVCLAHQGGNATTLANGPTQITAAKVRVTTNANPGAGIIRLSIHYRTFTAPTS